jgi:hypothetical protein
MGRESKFHHRWELFGAYSIGSMDSAGSGAVNDSAGSGYMFVPSIGSGTINDSIGSGAIVRRVVCCTNGDHIMSIS